MLCISFSAFSALTLVLMFGQLEHTHTHTRLTAICPGLPEWAGIRKVKPIWILLKQETVSGSGISWAICKSAPRSRQIATPATHHSAFYRPGALPAAQPTASKHWRDLGSWKDILITEVLFWNTRSGSDWLQLFVKPSVKLSAVGRRACAVAASPIWNGLPTSDVIAADLLLTLRRPVKTLFVL